MSRRVVRAFCCLLYSAGDYAGHGLLNAFAGIGWLPPAGIAPNSALYRFERWAEQVELRLVAQPAERITLDLKFARERLAEAEAMVRARDAAATATAMTAYRECIERVAQAALETAHDAQPTALESIANSLLEHQYIIATDYQDLPRDSRRALAAIINTASTRYSAFAAQLPRRTKEALFFKEEEVRWSWEMALAADAQGL